MKVVYLNDEKAMSGNDPRQYFKDVAAWAQNHCQSFVSYSVTEVSDVSPMWDYVAEFRFRDSKDAVFFEMKWV